MKKLKTPKIKELDSLEGTDRGAKGYGSTGVSAEEKNESEEVVQYNSMNEGKATERKPNNVKSAMNEKTLLSQSRRLITARQMSKLAKGDSPVFLAIVRPTNYAPKMKRANKRSSSRAVQFVAAHGMSEGHRRQINKREGPKKDIIIVAERERQVLDSVPINHRERLAQLIQ